MDKQVRKHELVAVEYGKSIDAVTAALVKAAAEVLAGLPEYAGCQTAAYAPERLQAHRRVRRYEYEMMGIVYHAEENIIIDFGIMEETDAE